MRRKFVLDTELFRCLRAEGRLGTLRFEVKLCEPSTAIEKQGLGSLTARVRPNLLFWREMREFPLENKNGIRMLVSGYGGIVRELHVPDRDGAFEDVVLGFDEIDQYDCKSPYFGALVGRYGNRIAKGKFRLEGKVYTLAQNNGENHLHGGIKGFDKVVWDSESISGEGWVGVRLNYTSKDGEEGYPGNLKVAVHYKLTDQNEWIVEYEATTDKPTVFNPTQHTYFNLMGHASGQHLEHEVLINADRYTPVDENLIPTGQLESVDGTPFDFRELTGIGARIEEADEQLERGRGYDHNFVLKKGAPNALDRAAFVYEPKTGRTLEVLTTEPGVQFYTGNFLDGSLVGKEGTRYRFRNGFCLETQHFPDSPNQLQFPSTRLDPGAVFQSTTVYRFGVQ